MGYLLVNNLFALAGYYGAAFIIDRPCIGRKRLQMFSFVACAAVFFPLGVYFNTASAQVLMTLFFLSSFFVSIGANTTTYVMAAETYPTGWQDLFRCGSCLASAFFFHPPSPLSITLCRLLFPFLI